jgi:putative Mn2+ efflux pump MntP
MDAFAVSIGLGSKHEDCTKSLAIMVAIYFGILQGIMPLIGYLSSESFLKGFASYAHWFSFSLLLLIGIKMIYESMNDGIEHDIAKFSHRIILMLAIATSIDAMAAGFTLPLLDVNPFISCLIIGITTLIFSWAGVLVGAKSGTWLESKAELFGGVLLILVGLKIVFF